MHTPELLGLECMLVLMLEEKREYILPPPPGIAELAPVIIIAGLPAHVDHAVKCGAATQNLPARKLKLAAVEPWLTYRLEAPIGPRIAKAIQVPNRDMDPDVVTLATGLEKQNANARVG